MSFGDDEKDTVGKEKGVSFHRPRTKTKAGFYIELFILATLFVLTILDFFELLSPELHYMEKIMAWTAMGYLLYRASLSHIFFGERYPFFDATIVIGYFAMVLNNLIHYARIFHDEMEGGEMVFDEESGVFVQEAITHGHHVVPEYLANFYGFLVEHEPLIIIIGFFVGFTILGLLAIYVGKAIEIRSPSLLDGIGIHGQSTSLSGSLARSLLCMTIFIGFFVIVFKIMMEWLAVAVHAPLIMIGFVIYFFGGNLGVSERIEKISTYGDEFYEEFIELFKKKKTLVWGIAGMLVLHLLTDIPNLMFPYLFGITDTMYHGAVLDFTVWEVILEAIQGMGLYEQTMLWAGYSLNILGILFLMVAPAYIWYHIYKESEFDMNPVLFFIFGASVTYYLLNPVFIVEMIDSPVLVGVGMGFNEISPSLHYLLISLGVGIIFMISSFFYYPEKIFVMISVIFTQLFFLRHMYYYLVTSVNLYGEHIMTAIAEGPYANILFMGSIGLVTIAFYSLGPIGYIVKTWK